ncbi:putative cytosol aminopeptidase [Pseudoclavibacter endophyticus]|uniref:Probable cytosol aminopeptidase n=1 Tax=Pseudoclavibacter endophyticus TaxID=1778590 RepID=A0A6H9WGD8_9MICO|nr:leucyl aminopeptidase [Pseudoclavibacter endophyticus]KAB1650019.1 leucyl aminopeptidase [Pseudoclavibacter endophyticus]GGA57932.1 putative cytosol aminopeptidase [Pseudoclavibacter endophyticus]
MLIPDFETRSSRFDDDVVTIIGVRDADGTPELLPTAGAESLADALGALGATGKHGEVTRALLGAAGRTVRVALLGLGSGDPTVDDWRAAAGSAARALGGEPAVAVAVDGLDDALAEQIAIGYTLGAYRFENYRSETKPPIERLVFVVEESGVLASALERARIVSSAVALVRDLVNTPANDLSPANFADLASATVGGLGITTEVLDEAALEAGGYGGLLGVGRGSVRPPRLAVLRWQPQGARVSVALVGKGITFDTGGLSLKPAGSMVGMKFDMAGAAVVVGVMCALAQLQAPVAVTGYLCLAENMPSGEATRPDDVLTMRGGKTVEVTNTDAEGRLVMADALVDASSTHPDAIIDIATLTGAQVVALGNRTTGVMGNDDAWIERVTDAAARVGEPAWRMPIPEEVGKPLESGIADIANARPGNRAAGMLTAAWFLREFVGRTESGEPVPWVHLDIAGPANNDTSAFGLTPKGATGVMTRTLIEALESVGAEGVSPGGVGDPAV